MRETLTALAIVLILVLTAALAAPYFVDWNAQRGFVEARLSHALGQKVTIGGAIDLKLLPTPYLVLDQAVIGGDDGPITMGIHHLDLELSVTPLLHGEFDVVEARLEEPTIRLTLGRDRTLPPLSDAPAFKADVRFDKISVVDGTLAIADPLSGYTFSADHLDFGAEVDSLAGPYKGSGAAGEGAARTKFRFASSAAQNGKARVKLVIDETPAHAGLDLDGMLALDSAARDSIRQTFKGTASLGGHVDDEGETLLPWRLSGPLTVDPTRAVLEQGEFRLGVEDHAIRLAANGDIAFGEVAGHLALVGKQLDVDRLFGGGVTATGDAVAPKPPSLAALRRSLAGVVPPVPLDFDLAVETATYGGETVSDLAVKWAFGAPGPHPVHLSGAGPGRSRLTVDGMLDPAANETFQGSVAVAAADAPAALDWLAGIAPDLGVTKRDVPFHAIDAKARVVLGDAKYEARDLALRLDRSSLDGSLRFTPAASGRAAAIAADLHAKALDLDALPDLEALRGTARAMDLDFELDARAIKVARFGDGTLDAGRIKVSLARAGDHIALRALRVEGLGGATVDATASLDHDGGTVDATLDAAKLVDAAALARRVFPGAASAALIARAPALAPAKLAFSAVLKPGADGRLEPRALKLAGTLGATTLDAALTPDAADPDRLAVTASAAAPKGGALLRQIGLDVLPLDDLGASRMTLTARGPWNGALDGALHLDLGGSTLDLAGRGTIFAANRSGDGSLKLVSRDLSPLLQALAIAFPDPAGRIAADAESGVAWTSAGLSFANLKGRIGGAGVSGSLMWHAGAKSEPALTGSLALDRLSLATLIGLSLGPPQPPASGALWSATPFGPGLIDPPRAVLDLGAKTIDLGEGLAAGDARLTLDASRGLLALTRFEAKMAGGRLGADLTIRRDGATAAVEGKIVVSDAALDLPSATGKITGHLDLAGSGRSALALIASLAGTGEATIADLRVPHADPDALPRVFDDVEADRLSVDAESIVRALDDAAKTPLDLGARSFALGLAAGVLHLEPQTKAGAVGSVVSGITASLDLRAITIDERVEQTLTALPKDWTGPPPAVVTTMSGRLDHPDRGLDVSAFINALATRALARETARIEAYEADARERAFFTQRLQSDRRREQERLKAEEMVRQAAEAARKAEAERRAKEAAARADRARRAEEAARAAQERAAQAEAARERAAEQRRQETSRPLDIGPGAGRPDPASPGPPTDPSAGR